jgi:uncharacterized protein (DUF302 family)
MSGVTNFDLFEHFGAASLGSTVERLERAIERAGMTVFARIDHAACAREIGMEMSPTVVLIFGNARGGTPIMLAAPSAALHLPLRVLVREAADGRAMVSFHPVAPMLRQARVPDALPARFESAQRILAEAIRALWVAPPRGGRGRGRGQGGHACFGLRRPGAG